MPEDDIERVEQYDLGDKPSLTSLYINPTKYCNLCCRHCWVEPPVSTGGEDTSEEMSIDQIIDIVKEAEKTGAFPCEAYRGRAASPQ